jgi:phosphate transport system protein
MLTTPDGFAERLARLKADLVEQGRRVQTLLELAFEAVFSADAGRAARVVAGDDVIDRVDVEIEKAAVQLLTDATHEGAQLDVRQLRGVLTIAKVNNELERIADSAVAIAERVDGAPGLVVPDTFRVMANSVVGILRDVNRSLDRMDPKLARVVLQSDDCVADFKDAILRDAETRIAAGAMTVDAAFLLHEFATQCERVADHCTNIAEQVIYSATGAIIRHTEGHWHEVATA